MKYLLDTHVIIWHFDIVLELPQKIIEIIENNENNLYISTVSLWEIAIKMNLGKLNLSIALDDLLPKVKQSNVKILHIENGYLTRLLSLPYLHKDPFDRLLISTAVAENLTIITIDENIQKYDVAWVW